MTATKIQPGDDLHLTSLMAPHSLNFVTGPDRAALLAYGRDVFAAARDSKCLAQIEEPAQQIAGYRISDPSDPTIKPWLSETPDDNGYTSEPLYAGAAPAAVAPQGERQWICPTRTVADLVNNLLTMDQALPIYGAQYIERDGRRCAIAVSPTVSRERVKDGRWIGQGEELNAAVVWTRAEQPAGVAGPAMDVTLDEDQAGLLRDMLGDREAYPEAITVRLMVGDGHSGHGLYVAQAEYQDEGAVLLASLPAPAAPALEAPAAPMREVLTDGQITDALWRTHLRWMEQCGIDTEGMRPTGTWLEHWLIYARAVERAALAAAPQAPAAPAEDAHVFTTPCPELNDLLRETSFLASEGANIDGAMLWLESLERVLALLAAPAAPAVDASDAELLDFLQKTATAVEVLVQDEGEPPRFLVNRAISKDVRSAIKMARGKALAAQANEGGESCA